MEVKDNGTEIIIKHKGATIKVRGVMDGLNVINVSENATAVHRRNNNRDDYLFTNAQLIHAWKEYDLIII